MIDKENRELLSLIFMAVNTALGILGYLQNRRERKERKNRRRKR